MMEGDVPNIEDLNIQLQVQPNYNQPKSIQVGLNFHALLYQMDSMHQQNGLALRWGAHRH